MIVYHLVDTNSLKSILRHGLQTTSRGSKGKEQAIIQADHYLDNCRPSHIRQANVSRSRNAYAYLPYHHNSVINITDGSIISLALLNKSTQQSLLALQVNPRRCCVSDLDAFDRFKSALDQEERSSHLSSLAKSYWLSVIQLSDYQHHTFRRPEVMITYDIEPQHIQVIT